MSSFLSERTVDYALVPLVKNALEKRFGATVPLFYWKSREGNRVSSGANSGRCFKVLAMFSRRPKVTNNPAILMGKINSELLDFSRAANVVGVPTISGFPAVRSIWELHENPLVYWIEMDTRVVGDVLFQVEVLPNYQNKFTTLNFPLHTLSLEQVADMVGSSAETYSWGHAMDILSDLRMASADAGGFMGWLGGYKPVYFLVSMAPDKVI